MYELAVKQALEGKTAKKRIDSIIILTELGRTIDNDKLKAKDIDLEAVLIRIAESEKHPFVLGIVEASVSNNMRPESQIRILEKLKQSPFLSDLKLRVTEKAIKRAHLRLEQEKQEKDKEKTKE